MTSTAENKRRRLARHHGLGHSKHAKYVDTPSLANKGKQHLAPDQRPRYESEQQIERHHLFNRGKFGGRKKVKVSLPVIKGFDHDE